MRFIKIVASVAIVRTYGVSAISVVRDRYVEDTDLGNATSIIEARDTFDCKGSSVCRTIPVKFCDETVNLRIKRTDEVLYGAPGSGKSMTGACAATCGVFIQGGAHCERSGNQIWWDYQDIRQNGCGICGSKHWGGDCLTTINYVNTCGNV
ncbi:uncharacterized protein PG998_014682 [Apiospora kogelbergensis]|uniref:uncharacterized protein n=1 Tax=Apiospora kogelbergensis TaxID=1337665 RepID=UPI00312CFA19